MTERNAYWRSPDLGEPRILDLPQGRVRYFDTGGQGTPLVFVHGAGVNANLWSPVVRRLAPQHRCLVLDLPFGMHEYAMPELDFTPAGLADLIADTIDAIGVEAVTLVGNDTGGGLCQILVTRRPERIGRLVLTSSDAYEMTLALRLLLEGFSVVRLPRLARAVFAPLRVRALRRPLFAPVMRSRLDPQTSDSFLLPYLENAATRQDAKRFIEGIDFAELRSAASRFAEFDRPVLIAWSADDILMPREHAERLADDFPNARLEWIEDSRTFSPLDQPARVAELIAGFVADDAVEQPTDLARERRTRKAG